MNEEAKEITVKLKPIPNEQSSISFNIKSNAKVSELEEKVKGKLGKLNNVPMGILKFNEQELDDKNKTLDELCIINGSEIENENRVFLKTLNGKEIGITCDGNTTLKGFLEKASNSKVLQNDVFIRLIFEGRALSRKDLGSKLFSVQTLSNNGTIGYGSILHMVLLKTQEESNYDTVFNLKNLDSTSEEVKKAYEEYQKSKTNIINKAEQVFYKKDIKVHSPEFGFNLKTSENEYDHKDSKDDKLDIFINVCNASGEDKDYLATAKKNTTVMDLIRDNWNIFKGFSEGFIIVVNSELITGESNLEEQLTTLDNVSRIKVYLAGSATCREKSLIKIEDLKLALKKNNNGNYVSKTDLANKNNWPFSRIIVGIIDLILLAAAITTFVLDVYLAIPIVLTVLCVFIAILFFGWNKIFSKIRRKPPKYIETSYGNRNGQYKSEQYEKESKITENDLEPGKKNPTEIIYRSNK